MFRRLTSYLLAMLLATIGPTAVGQENTAIDPFGMDFVQLLFEQAGTRPVDIRAAISAPRQSVLVLTGRVPPPYQGFVRMFVVQGGTLLYASDRGSSRSNSWFHLASGPVTVNRSLAASSTNGGLARSSIAPVCPHLISLGSGTKEIK